MSSYFACQSVLLYHSWSNTLPSLPCWVFVFLHGFIFRIFLDQKIIVIKSSRQLKVVFILTFIKHIYNYTKLQYTSQQTLIPVDANPDRYGCLIGLKVTKNLRNLLVTKSYFGLYVLFIYVMLCIFLQFLQYQTQYLDEQPCFLSLSIVKIFLQLFQAMKTKRIYIKEYNQNIYAS